MASINDKFNEATSGTRPEPTTLTAQKEIGATSISVDALTGWPTATAVHFIMYRVGADGKKIAGSQTDWKGIASGTTISSLQLKAGTDDVYAIGAVVEAAPTAAWADDVVEGISNFANQDGTLKSTAVNTAIANGSITYAKLLSTIFSGQVTTLANTGTAGGTLYYTNLGGIKVCWGVTATITVNAALVQRTVNLPGTFLTTIQFHIANAVEGSAGQRMVADSQAVSTSGMTLNVWDTSGSTTNSSKISFLVIGT